MQLADIAAADGAALAAWPGLATADAAADGAGTTLTAGVTAGATVGAAGDAVAPAPHPASNAAVSGTASSLILVCIRGLLWIRHAIRRAASRPTPSRCAPLPSV